MKISPNWAGATAFSHLGLFLEYYWRKNMA